ncbi:hypothetical protein B7R54_18790 [Subtercola boreus]|uniref:DUF8175 domain-containing protein n=1 Tax=Subtercola boreus TaxID=120213 RepID=A0A3E0V9T7_9MICO|nr:hypothetical protein [Subtercola boreus]RFA06429.1 hypothetical protein B7R54_18790 [Subtercola boreus]TQL46872.1 hypothetical protein FB464_3866 [Subtercola boreus]
MSDAEPRNPFTRKGFIFGAITVGALAGAAVLLAFTSQGGGGDQNNPVAASTPGVTATATIDPAAASVCGLAGYETAPTLTSAPTTKWSIIGTVAAPNAPDAGPGVTGADGVRSCYSHTSEGALFAIANWWALGTDARIAKAAIEQLAEPGPGRDAALAKTSTSATRGLSAQIAGFKVLSYDGSAVTVDLAWRTNTGQLVSVPAAAVWLDGDWKISSADDGTSPFPPSALQSLGGYTPWAGI